MKITIEELPESRIAYFRNGGKQNKELMESFKEWAKINGVFDNSTILGIPQDNPQVTPKEASLVLSVVLDADKCFKEIVDRLHYVRQLL